MITEQEYLAAIKIINEYTEQIKQQTEQILKKTGTTKTPAQLSFSWHIYFPSTGVRLWNILKASFNDKRLCDITKKEFLSAPMAGKKSWSELCAITKSITAVAD